VSCLALFQTVPHRSVIPYVPFRLPPLPTAAFAVAVSGGVVVGVVGGVVVGVVGVVVVGVVGGVVVGLVGVVCVPLPVVGDAL
jgi:hypothetical protein